MNRNLFLSLLLSWAILPAIFAQDVRVSYEIVSNGTNLNTVKVYAQSFTEKSIELAGVNFSFALPQGCEMKTLDPGPLLSSWTNYLQDQKQRKELALSYEGRDFTKRLQYGNADPGLPATAPITLPLRSEDPFLLMEVTFKGAGSERIYLENQQENRLNQLGNSEMKPLEYVIEPLHRQGAPEPEAQNLFTLFPNPAEDYVNIELLGQLEKNAHYYLSDMSGKIIEEGMMDAAPAGGHKRIEIAKLAEGAYFMKLINADGENFVSKFIKK